VGGGAQSRNADCGEWAQQQTAHALAVTLIVSV
jgi:hypothetical protein